VYSWVRDGNVVYRGVQAAKLLLKRQLSAITVLKANGMRVKINTIVIPGANEHHVLEVAAKMAELGVDIQNCMTMYATQGTPFERIGEPSLELMSEVRNGAEKVIPQMRHCTRCRAISGQLDTTVALIRGVLPTVEMYPLAVITNPTWLSQQWKACSSISIWGRRSAFRYGVSHRMDITW